MSNTESDVVVGPFASLGFLCVAGAPALTLGARPEPCSRRGGSVPACSVRVAGKHRPPGRRRAAASAIQKRSSGTETAVFIYPIRFTELNRRHPLEPRSELGSQHEFDASGRSHADRTGIQNAGDSAESR
jgi:hypothetical protein